MKTRYDEIRELAAGADPDPTAWDEPIDHAHRDIKRAAAIATSVEAALSIADAEGLTIKQALATGIDKSIVGHASMSITAIEDRR